MKKEIILKNLLKTLIDNRLEKLEKKQIEEMKDIKIIKSFFINQEELIKSFIPEKKSVHPKKNQLVKNKTNITKLSTTKRPLRQYTPFHRKLISSINPNYNNNKINNSKIDNFSHVNKPKIDGNYKTKNKNNDNVNKTKICNKYKKYKTPIRNLYTNSSNSISKYKKDKANIKKPVTPSLSFYNNTSNISYKEGTIINSMKNREELIDSINRANKSYIFKNIKILDTSNYNTNNNSNSYINNNSNSKTHSSRISFMRRNIEINIRKKNKTNLYLEKFLDKFNNFNYNFIFNNNYGDWLCTEDGSDILILISNFLDIKSKYNLISFRKKYIKYLYQMINDKYTEFKEINNINPNSNLIQEKINQIKEKYSPNDLNIDNNKLVLSKSSLKALEILNNKGHEKFFNNKNYNSFSDDIYIVYKIIFQLIKNNEIKNSSNKKEFFEKMGKYVYSHLGEKGGVGDFFKNMVNEFEFNKQNIYKIKIIIKGKEEKLQLRNYSQICSTTGLVIFLVKDILEYLGFIFNGNKTCPGFILMNLEFLEEVKTKLPNYLKFLQNLFER